MKPRTEPQEPQTSAESPPHPHRSRYVNGSIAIVLLLVAIAVGIAVGLTLPRKNADNNANTTNTAPEPGFNASKAQVIAYLLLKKQENGISVFLQQRH